MTGIFVGIVFIAVAVLCINSRGYIEWDGYLAITLGVIFIISGIIARIIIAKVEREDLEEERRDQQHYKSLTSSSSYSSLVDSSSNSDTSGDVGVTGSAWNAGMPHIDVKDM